MIAGGKYNSSEKKKNFYYYVQDKGVFGGEESCPLNDGQLSTFTNDGNLPTIMMDACPLFSPKIS